jgi:hypothetical protein
MFKLREISIDYEIFPNADSYLQIFGSGESEMYLVRYDNDETVYYVSPAANIYCEPAFKSLSSMMDCIIECYESGVFKVHSTKGLVTDFQSYYRVLEKYK